MWKNTADGSYFSRTVWFLKNAKLTLADLTPQYFALNFYVLPQITRIYTDYMN